MAKTTTRKKAAAGARRAPAKPAPKRPAPKVKGLAKKPAAKKSAAKSAPAKKPAAKPKTATKAKPAPSARKPARKPASKAVRPAPAASQPSKRPVAVSHRPQAAVAVQPRPAKPAAARPRAGEHSGVAAPGTLLTEDQIRRAPDSAYMNDSQLAFFQERLLQMRSEVLARELDVKERLHQREIFADPADRASAEEEHWLDLRLRERESLLLKKIDEALRRIRDKEYGWCEKTGEPIGIARLLARPTATVCVDIKGQDERAESQYRDR